MKYQQPDILTIEIIFIPVSVEEDMFRKLSGVRKPSLTNE